MDFWMVLNLQQQRQDDQQHAPQPSCSRHQRDFAPRGRWLPRDRAPPRRTDQHVWLLKARAALDRVPQRTDQHILILEVLQLRDPRQRDFSPRRRWLPRDRAPPRRTDQHGLLKARAALDRVPQRTDQHRDLRQRDFAPRGSRRAARDRALPRTDQHSVWLPQRSY